MSILNCLFTRGGSVLCSISFLVCSLRQFHLLFFLYKQKGIWSLKYIYAYLISWAPYSYLQLSLSIWAGISKRYPKFTLVKINELPFSSTHSILLIIMNDDIILSVTQIPVIFKYSLLFVNHPLIPYSLSLLWLMPQGGPLLFPNWFLAHFLCYHQSYF